MKTFIFKKILLLSLLSFIPSKMILASLTSNDPILEVSIASFTPNSDAPIERKKDHDQNQDVGLLIYNRDPICAGKALKHGLLLTAKHCFQHLNLSPETIDLSLLEIGFSKKGEFPFADSLPYTADDQIRVTATQIIFDSGDNDLAYVLYSSSETKNKMNISEVPLFLDQRNKSKLRDLETIGYPATPDYPYDSNGMIRVVTVGCKETDQEGRILKSKNDLGYEGLLQGTTCAVWFGNSGGPVYAFEKEAPSKKVLVGVVTHTFDIDKEGSLLPDKMKKDEFGYFMKSNYSPISDAKNLLKLLKMVGI